MVVMPVRRRQRGFTLVELLVVISILSLLLSMLVPTLQRARVLTVRAVCATRVKAILSGSFSYAGENRDFFPARDGPYLPHVMYQTNASPRVSFDLHKTFFTPYVPTPISRQIVSGSTSYVVSEAESAMFCPGPIKRVRGPEVPGWNSLSGYAYHYSTYQYFNFEPSSGRALVPEGSLPLLRHQNAPSKYALWSCLTVDKRVAYLGHDVPEKPFLPSGMTGGFVNGSVGWIEWDYCEPYWNDDGQDFWWPMPR